MFGTRQGRIERELGNIGTLLNQLSASHTISAFDLEIVRQIQVKVTKLHQLSGKMHDLIDAEL